MRIDVLFATEREIKSLAPRERLCARQECSRPLLHELEAWSREQRGRLYRKDDRTKAINCCLGQWDTFTRSLNEGRP